jgi:glycogen operon protein
VLLDVVFNHTAEGNHLGPTLCHRGIDNAAYYRLDPNDPRLYVDTTGTGNSLNVGDPITLQLIMDSLRYWLIDMRVDGFRFDLAPTLARQAGGFNQTSAFLDLVSQDPVVSQAKLVAEPWDVGQGDTGSADLYADSGRRPTASVNLITVHDGFTLADLVSYNQKHNEANGESNRDGTGDNRSWNCGEEGPTTDPAIVSLRARQQRAMLSTLLLSFGVPLLLAGDEMGRTQLGNNNAYCQDNATTWFDWSHVDTDLLGSRADCWNFAKPTPCYVAAAFWLALRLAKSAGSNRPAR